MSEMHGIGGPLKKFREDMGASQREFAIICGFSQQEYSQIETNKTDVTTKQLQRIAQKLQIRPAYLLGSLKSAREPKPSFKDVENASVTNYGKYFKKIGNRYTCVAEYCGWRDENGVCMSGSGCMKEWMEKKGMD